jgi:hypothetical protein
LFALVLGLSIYGDGWRRLAKRYRTTQLPLGRRWTFQRVRAGWTRPSNLVTLTTNSEGVFLEEFWSYRLWRPRLFIPWQNFHDARRTKYSWWLAVEVQVGYPTIATLWMEPEIFAQSEGRTVVADR